MDYTHLGRSGLSVSRLVLGTMNFGPQTEEPDSHRIMDRALEHRLNFFDTAHVYGWQQGEGITEQIIGRWFAQGGGRREKVVIATKLYGSMRDWPNDTFLSARNIRHACDGSLKRLQTDHIDLYQMHHVDRSTPWEEIWQEMEQLVREGKISYVGRSNFAAWDVALAQCAASARHFMGLTSEQSLYNLAVRTVEMELIPALRSLGIGLLPYSPLHAGLLAGALEAGSGDDRIEAHRDQLEAYEALCREGGAKPAGGGVGLVRGHPLRSP